MIIRETHIDGEADMIGAQNTIADWVQLVRSEYLEIPGLHLTKRQAQRLWNLDVPLCDALLAALTEVKFLELTPNGSYVRMDAGAN